MFEMYDMLITNLILQSLFHLFSQYVPQGTGSNGASFSIVSLDTSISDLGTSLEKVMITQLNVYTGSNAE